jgi:Fe-S-cluster-containing hydrogenase component 2
VGRVNYVAELDLDGCTGCKWCDIVCPSGAITVADKKAIIDGARCIGCSQCVDKCPEDVMWMTKREAPLKIGGPPDDDARPAIIELLGNAKLPVDLPICPCMLVSTTDVAAAVTAGASSLEEVCAATGLRAGCGIYCVAPALRILKTAGADMTPPKGYRWYDVTLSLWDLENGPLDGAAQTYVREDLEAFDPDSAARHAESQEAVGEDS